MNQTKLDLIFCTLLSPSLPDSPLYSGKKRVL
uniref:Uncharacterized protein n=1 Tax=Arundo donax TaxID=35708 RepID=A0A0A8YX80_ARUDO